MKFMKNKFLAGDNVTVIDFYFLEFVEFMAFVTGGEIFDDYPKLVQYHKDMTNLPKLKEYLESDDCREKTYIFNNKMAKVNNHDPNEVKNII